MMEKTALILTLISGAAWTVVYLSLIRTGFRDKTYGMPLFALALNLGWEAVYTIYGFTTDIENIQTWVNLVWCMFDIAILYTYFKYGREDFEKYADRKFFAPWTILIFIMAFILQYGFLNSFPEASAPGLDDCLYFVNSNLGCWYSAFIQNLIMSVLFINMLALRKSRRGQNLTIGVSKWIGTLAPTITFGCLFGNSLILILGLFCSVFDLIYIRMLMQYRK